MHAQNRKQRIAIWPLSALTIMALTAPNVAAQDAKPEAINEDAESASHLHFSAGIDYASDYYFRGIIQETNGSIWQPWAEIGVDLYSFDNGALSATFGTWSSWHGEGTGASSADNTVEDWYETDLYAGLNLDLGDFSFSGAYILYTSPNGAFGTVKEFDLSVGYDDSELLGDFSLSPSATLAFETGDNFADGIGRGVYLELGIEPGHEFDGGAIGPISVALPVTLGLSLDDYYQDGTGDDDSFGFFDVGLAGSVGLNVPEGYGAWSLSAGVHVLLLGDNNEALNAGDDTEVYATVGVSDEF